MAYKFQFGDAEMSGALEQVGDLAVSDDQGQFRMLVDRDVGNMQLAGSGTFGTTVSGAGNFTVTNGSLVLSEVAVTAHGAELNYLDITTLGTAENSKAFTRAADASWTAAGSTCADLGTVTTADINGGNIDGTIIGATGVAAGSFAAVVGTSLSVGDGNITNVGDIALDTISADGTTIEVDMTDNTAEAFNISEASTDYLKFDTTNGSELITIGVGWTAGSQTCTDLGTVTTADINGGTVDGTTIGATTHTTGKFTTCDATTNFTIDGLVLTADTITNDAALTVVSTGFTVNASLDIALSADGGNVTMDDGTTTVFDFNTDEPAMKIMDDANVLDYYSVAVGANGATTISTVDADAALANLTITADGTVDINSTGDLTLDSSADIVLDAAGLHVKPASNDQCALGVAGTAFSDLFLAEGGVINWDSGDATLTQASDVVTLAGATLTATFTNSLSKIADGGISMTDYDGSAAITDLGLNLYSLNDDDPISVSADSFAFIDANDSNATKKESVADLVSAMAGSGLDASAGVLSVQGQGTPTGVGNVLVTLGEGWTFGTTTLTASHVWTLPNKAGSTAGDIVRVKMPSNMGGFEITLTGSGAQTIDGQAALLPVEQAGAVINLIYLASDAWGLF
jgi:hypothetical protein